MIPYILGAAAVLGLLAAAAWRWRHRPEIDAAVTRHPAGNRLCPKCDQDPSLRCDCEGDCGRRYCDWATVISDREFTRKLAEMLAEGGSRG